MGVNGTLHIGDGDSGGWDGYENMVDMSEAVRCTKTKECYVKSVAGVVYA